MQKQKNIKTKLYMMITIILVSAYSLLAIEFYDTFNNSNPTSNPDGPDWTAQNSNAGWSESGTITDNGTQNTEGHLINDSSVNDDGIFTVKIHNGNNAGDLTSSHLGVLFRWTSTSSYYYMCFREASNTLNVTLLTNTITTSGGSYLTDNTWNTGSDPFWARVKVIADTFTVFTSTDGSTFDSLGRFVDATHSTGSGFGIGCVGDWNSGPTIDSIHWKDTLVGGDVVKANNTTDLNVGTSWVGSTVPLSYDTAVWDNTVTVANTVSLGANQTWAGIKIEDPGGAVTINNNTVTLGSGGIDMSTGTPNLTISSSIALGGNQDWNVVGASRVLTASGAISGAYSIDKKGTGILRYTNNSNTYSGGTTISAGKLQIGANTSGGSLPGNVTNNSELIFYKTSDYTYSGVISGTGTVAQSGSNTTTLSSNNTYTGATSITNGTLKITGAGNNATASSGFSVSSGAVLEFDFGNYTRLSGSAISITGAGTVRKSGTSYNYLAQGATTQSFNMSSGALIDVTGGTLAQFTTSSGNLADLTIASGATALVNDADANDSVYFDVLSGAGTFDAYGSADGRHVILGVDNGSGTFSGTLGVNSTSGDVFIYKRGTGTQTLSGNNGYDGITKVQEGVLNIQHANALGATITATYVSSGAALELQGGITIPEALYLNGTGISSGGALRSVSGGNSVNGNISLSSSSSVANDDVGNYFYLNGVISGSGDLTKVGTGPIVLIGNNTYSGTTNITSGELWIYGTNVLGATSSGTVVSSGAVLALYGNMTSAAEPLTLNGTGGGTGALLFADTCEYAGDITLNTNSYIGTDVASTVATISGAISGANDFTKVGSGVLKLTGTNTFSGNTNISVGELRVNGSTSNSSAVSMTAGTRLSGTGSVGGYVSMSPTATINPGDNGAGKLTLEDGIAFVSTCTLNVEIGTNNDTLAVVGGVVPDGILNIDSISGFATGDYVIVTSTGTVTNSLVVGSTPNAAYDYSLSAVSGELILTISSNNDPTAINLSSSNVDEGLASGAVVGVLTTTDADVGDNHTYSLPGGELDNSLFAIDSDSLETGTIFDYENGDKTYDVSILTDDGNGGTFKDSFTITINNTLTASGDTNEIDFSNGWQIGGGSADARQLASAKYFDGHLDEIRIENTARNADWIKLCYETQRLDQNCLTFVADDGVDLLPLTVTNNVGTGTNDTIMVYTDSFTIIFDESQGGGIKWLSNAANKGGTNQVTSGSTVTLFDIRYYTNSYSVSGTLTLLESNSLFAKVKQEFQIGGVDWDVFYTVYGDGRIYIDVRAYNSSGSDQSNTLIFRTYRNVIGTSNLIVSEASAATSDFLLNADNGAGQFDLLLSPFNLWSDASGIDSGTATDARIGYRDVSRVLKNGYEENWSFLISFGHKNWNDTTDDVHYFADAYQNPDSLEMNRGTYRLTKAWEEQLLFHYNFDQETTGSADGDTVVDYSEANPTLYNGVIEGGTWTTGRWGDGALTLASADSIAIINASALGALKVLTITGWIKKSGTGESDALIFGDDNATTAGFKLTSDSDKLKLFAGNNTVIGNTALGTDWTFVAASANKHSGWIKLYVDGKIDTTFNTDLSTNWADAVNAVSVGNGFAGDLDDIRVFSKEISEETIYAMYNNSYRAGQGMYSVRCDNNSSIDLQIDGSSINPIYNPVFEITNYWGTSKPSAVYYDGDWMTENTNYICYLDDASNKFYIGFKKVVRSNNLRIYLDDFDSTGAWSVGPTKKMVWGTSGSDFYVQNFEGTAFGSSSSDEWYLYWKMDSTYGAGRDGDLSEFKSSEVSPSTAISSAINVIPDLNSKGTFGAHEHDLNGTVVSAFEDVNAVPTYTVLESSDVRIRLRINNRTIVSGTESFGIRSEWTLYPTGQVFKWDSIYAMSDTSISARVQFYIDSGNGSVKYEDESNWVAGIYGNTEYKDFAVALLNGKKGGSVTDLFTEIQAITQSTKRGFQFKNNIAGWPPEGTPYEMAFAIEIGEQGFNTTYIDSFAAGYRSVNFTAPDMTIGTRLTNSAGDMDADGFDEKEGVFTVQASNNTVDFKAQAGGVDGSRFYPAIKVSNYYASYKPKFVHLYAGSDTATLVEGYQYNCYLNKTTNELIIQLDTVLTADVNCYISDDEDLAVTMSEFYAKAGQNCDTLFWTTESEHENLGFWIYRRKEPKYLDSLNEQLEEDDVDTSDGIIRQMSRGSIRVNDTVWAKVNSEIIPGAEGGTSYGPRNYEYIDKGLLNNMLYEYKLISVSYKRVEEAYGPVTAMPLLQLPKAFALLPNYPNPVRSYTNIRFNLPVESKVNLFVYNLQGRLIKKILNAEEIMKPGFHKVLWNLDDVRGLPVASGPYIYRMKAGKFVKSRMMIIVK